MGLSPLCPAVMWPPLVVCPGLVAVGALQRCARPTASVARILQHLTRPVLCRVPVRCAPLVGLVAVVTVWPLVVRGWVMWWPWWWLSSARLLPRCGIVAAVSGCDVVAAWWCVRDWWPLLGVGWFVAGCGSHRRGCSDYLPALPVVMW